MATPSRLGPAIRPQIKSQDKGRYGCLRLSTRGAEQIWALPEEVRFDVDPNNPDDGLMRSTILRDGIAYLGRFSYPTGFELVVVEAATGKVLLTHQPRKRIRQVEKVR